MTDERKTVSVIAGSTPSSSPVPSTGPDAAQAPSKPLTDDELPNNVTTSDQLADLPHECLSGDKEKPLRHVDEEGNVFHYALQPMFYSVIYILVVELLERFCFYGVNYTQTAYLSKSRLALSSYSDLTPAIFY